jgi:hypothetical protein
MWNPDMSKPILCVDFDGVVHSYASGWQGIDKIPDPPVPGALAWLMAATEHFDVQIYSSRSKQDVGRWAMYRWFCDHAEREFGPNHPMANRRAVQDGPAYPVTFAAEKPAAFLTIDDRAICFGGDWAADHLAPAELLKFLPWNKR